MVVGAADSVSTIIRNTIRQLQTPDYIRGRMTSINQIFFMGGPQLGEVEAGVVAQLFGAPFAIISGGIGYPGGSGVDLAPLAAVAQLRWGRAQIGGSGGGLGRVISACRLSQVCIRLSSSPCTLTYSCPIFCTLSGSVGGFSSCAPRITSLAF